MDDKERIENVIRMLTRATSDVVAQNSPESESYWRAVIDITDAVAEFWKKHEICPEYGVERVVALINYLEEKSKELT